MDYNDTNKLKNPGEVGALSTHVKAQDGFQRKAQAAHVGSANSRKFTGVEIGNKGSANKAK